MNFLEINTAYMTEEPPVPEVSGAQVAVHNLDLRFDRRSLPLRHVEKAIDVPISMPELRDCPHRAR